MDVSFITLNYKMNCKFDIKYVFHTDRVFCIVNYVCQNRFGDTRVLWFLTSTIRVQYDSLVTRFVLRQDIYFNKITIIRTKEIRHFDSISNIFKIKAYYNKTKHDKRWKDMNDLIYNNGKNVTNFSKDCFM